MIETSATLGSDIVGRRHTMQRFSGFCGGMQPLHPPPAESEAVVLVGHLSRSLPIVVQGMRARRARERRSGVRV